MKAGDSAVVTGALLISPTVQDLSGRLIMGELVQVVEVDEFVQCALVWGADSGLHQWIGLESITEISVLFGGFEEGVYDSGS